MNQEIETNLKVLLKKLTNHSTGEKSWRGILNSPFCVTLVGGVLLALISGMVTQYNAEHTRKREIALEELHQKQRFIDSFCTNIEKYLALSYGVRKREIWINAWQSQPERDKQRYGDGRTFDETSKKWEEDARYWVEHSPGSALAVIYTGKLLFTNPAIAKKFDKLANNFDLYGRTTDFKILDENYDQIAGDLESVTSLMEAELHKD
jgi:hypothetical protein